MSKDKKENKFLKAIKKIKALPRTIKAVRDILTWINIHYDIEITKSLITQINDA
ncbi:hypothetical protein [Mycoplasmopsis agassizii]|uniref:hypothetical protein n=1 Tax=Mycoplasmopsis agassizii TaxID=33922 RepID=UPI0015DB1220|nr:hypothetical protein [Mycoplasmopsis agassizii]